MTTYNKKLLGTRLEALYGAIDTAFYLFASMQNELTVDEETDKYCQTIKDKFIDLSSDIKVLTVMIGVEKENVLE